MTKTDETIDAIDRFLRNNATDDETYQKYSSALWTTASDAARYRHLRDGAGMAAINWGALGTCDTSDIGLDWAIDRARGVVS